MDSQTQQAIETAKLLWVAIGVLIASNAGVFIKMYFSHLKDRKEEKKVQEKQQFDIHTEALQKLTAALDRNTERLAMFETDLNRFFTAMKLVAGKRWSSISKVIQSEFPKGRS